jgi:hypothetical protein
VDIPDKKSSIPSITGVKPGYIGDVSAGAITNKIPLDSHGTLQVH